MGVIRFAIESTTTKENVTNDGPVRTHTMQCFAETDDAFENQSHSFRVLKSILVPQLFSTHPEDPGATLRDRDAKQQKGKPNFWDVTLAYSTETPKKEDSKENPLEKRVIWSYTGNKITRLIDKDTDLKAVLNTAFDAPDPAIEVPATIPVAQAVSNEGADPWQKKLDYEDKINSHSFKGCEAGTLRLAQVDATEETKNNTTYWKVTYRFEYKRSGWQPSVLSQGFNQIISDEKIRILDEKNVPVTVPWPLNIAGIAFTKTELEEGASFYYDVKGYYTADFNQLRL